MYVITLPDYWMGRDKLFPAACTDPVKAAAAVTVARANLLLDAFYSVHPTAAPRKVNSGWRPAALNANVPGASRTSLHITGEAIDLSDDDGALDNWCMSPNGQAALERIGLWLEHPDATPRWSHVQCRAPKSGARIFRP